MRRHSENGNVFGNWTITSNPATGESRWAFFTSAPERLRVRATGWRDLNEQVMLANWNLVCTHPSVVQDITGGSRPPRSVRSAIAEQARKRRWNAARKAARQAERSATEPTLFG